jgi:hypothetical protein
LPTYSQWQTLIIQITEHVGDYKTMTKMIFSLREQTDIAIQARKVLTQLVTYGSDVKMQVTPENLPILRKLSAEGAIISPQVGIFEISSPLIRLLILQKVLPVDRRKVPLEPIPRTLPQNFLDIPAIILKALHYFNPEHIRTAYQISYKKK